MNEGTKERENNDGNKNEAMKKKDNIQSNSKCIIKLAVPLKSDENSIRVYRCLKFYKCRPAI